MEEENPQDKLIIMPLGAGCEVGRSCIILKYKGKTVMFDCGIHMAKTGQESLPYFDKIEPKDVDLLLVTHFHLDHAGAVPYFLEKTNFKGKCFMTYPTKAIYRLVLADSAKVTNPKEYGFLFDKKDINNSMDKIHPIDYHQERVVNGIKFICYNAGHVIGAAMFLVEIDGVRVLYTGDYSREEDRHLQPAEIPEVSVDVLICESTYGTKTHDSRSKREKLFTEKVSSIVRNGGNCLLPVFALGRAQELLLILEEYWHVHKDLQDTPIYYPCALAAKSMEIYQSYLNMMGPHVRQRFKNGVNPFNFKFIDTLKNLNNFEDFVNIAPSVIMASPGMLQNGLSRQIFEEWCTNEKNGVILTGYCVDGTLAKEIQSEPEQITKLNQQKADFKMSVDILSFSAHADYKQTSDFISELGPQYVILVHGEKQQVKLLYDKLTKQFPNIHVMNPQNTQSVQIDIQKKEQKCKFIKFKKIYGELKVELQQEINNFHKESEVNFQYVKQSLGITETNVKQENEEIVKKEDESKIICEKSIDVNGILMRDDNDYILIKQNDIKKYSNIQPKFIIFSITNDNKVKFGEV